MQTAATPTAAGVTDKITELLVVPIGKVVEHPANPRKFYNQQKMDELVASIRTLASKSAKESDGIAVPLTVRPLGPGYQILAGHRRSRAAKIVGLKEIPVMVRYGLSDLDAYMLVVTDNTERDDLGPLEEGLSYTHMIQLYQEQAKKDNKPKMLTADIRLLISKRIGKSVSHIYQMEKLASLIEPAQKMLFDGAITPGHAIKIARLTDSDQKRALDIATSVHSWPKNRPAGIDREGTAENNGTISVKALQQWIDEYIHVKVDSVAFDKSDAKLNPEAGPCIICKKLTGNDPTLHPEIKSPRICTDHSCFRKKVIAHFDQVYKKYGNRLYPITSGNSYIHSDHDKPLEAANLTPRSWQQSLKGPGKWKEYKLKSGETEKTKRIKYGIFVDGARKGECIPITLIEPKKKKSFTGSTSAPRGSTLPSPAQVVAEAAAEKKRQAAAELEWKIKHAIELQIADAILDKVTVPPRLILEELIDHYYISKELKLKDKLLAKASSLNDTMLAKAIVATFCGDNGWKRYSPSLAKQFKIDTKAIEKKVRAELTPKPDPRLKSPGHAPGWKKPAKKKGKKK